MDLVLGQLATVSVFVERAVQLVKSTIKYNEWAAQYQSYIDVGLSSCANIGLCWFWNVDLLAAAGFPLPAYPWVGPVVTGAVASLGSTFAHELIELLKMLRAGAAARISS